MKTKGISGQKRETVHIWAKTKILYMKAGDSETRKELKMMEKKEATDAMTYVHGLPGWEQEKERDEQEAALRKETELEGGHCCNGCSIM